MLNLQFTGCPPILFQMEIQNACTNLNFLHLLKQHLHMKQNWRTPYTKYAVERGQL